MTDKETQQLAGQTTGVSQSYLTANSQYDTEGMLNGFVGGTLFIGIFLSIIFMLGTVLVIYYKQISEGYEDRERFVILQRLDWTTFKSSKPFVSKFLPSSSFL